MTISADSLGKLRYFTGVEYDRLSSLPQLFNQRSFLKGQTIVSEGDHEKNLHFVNSGVVKVFKTSSEGKEQIIKIVRPGESFNDITVFSSGPSPYSVQALGNTIVYWIHKDNLIPVMEKNWRVAQNAFEVVAGQARLLLSLIEDLSFKNVTGRVAKILLQTSPPGPDGFQRLTQYEMAAMAGTAREVVGRSLKNLEEIGAIKLERHRIVITNKEYLNQLAGLS
ncbi:MAG: Crp/Fnr family transcriptional regulator [Dehalococcoidales bacterium]|nr:Crp/Fnr family transcriptional regulator [Dehalococcoidales bacterium]